MKTINLLCSSLFLLFVFTAFGGTVFGQTTLLSDDFEAGNLNSWTDDSTDNWTASTSSPLTGSYSLEHVDNGFAGVSILYSSITATDINTKVTSWQFNMKTGSFGPSGSNYFGMMLMGDEANPQSETFSGYVIGVNFDGTSDELILYKVANGTYTEIVNTGYTWGTSDFLGIKVERNSAGFWQVFYDSDGGFDSLISAGTVTDTDNTTFTHTSVYFEYTSSRAGMLQVDDVLIQQEDDTIKGEPANHVTSFTSTGDINSIDLEWTDATGSPTPDNYLIKVSTTSYAAISDPVDETTESDDTDLSDGSGILNVVHGNESASFSGLEELTTYYFKIYSYTNSGSDIDYRTDGTIPQDDATTLDAPDIVLNELLADPDASTGDSNGDSSVSSDDDEFVEFVNYGSSDLDISNWTIEESGSTQHTFSESTILKPYQAIVVFGGGTPTGSFGNAIVQTTSSLSMSNNSGSITLKNDSGVEILSYTYGSDAGDNQSLTRNPDLTGDFEKHETADTDDASSFSPGTRIDGSTFQPSVEITGSEGWRILSTPTPSSTYDDLLGDLWTQGIATDADVTTGTASVQTFDGSSFSGISDMGANMSVGSGFIVYVYSDDDYTNSGTDAGFPKTLEMFSAVNSGTVNPDITDGADSWTLVGNPYYADIDWDDLDKTDLTGSVYVYDHSYGSPDAEDAEATGSAGSYRVWNGTDGSLTGGLISSFQGFWVQNVSGPASASSPALTIEEADQASGGTFYKEVKEAISIRVQGVMENMKSEAYLSFTKKGLLEKDKYDGLKLTPLDFKNYLSVSTLTGNTKLDINNLPADFDSEIEIPVAVQGFIADADEDSWIPKAGEVTLSWPVMENLPEDWTVTFTDYETGKSVDMKAATEFVVTLDGEKSQAKEAPSTTILNPQPPQEERLRKSTEKTRFGITIRSKSATSNEATENPEAFTLQQNYPNPFNPTTSIQYSVGQAGPVTLSVYNVMGQKVATLVSETKATGTYRANWDAANMASGIYHYRLQSAGKVITKQMTLIK